MSRDSQRGQGLCFYYALEKASTDPIGEPRVFEGD